MRLFFIFLLTITGVVPALTLRAAAVRNIVFPVQGDVTNLDNFGDDRGGGTIHEGIDLMGEKMTPLIAAVDGRVVYAPQTQQSWGYGIWIQDSDGYEYVYIHINNDTPGTDDGNGGVLYAYASGIRQGVHVTQGQVIGWMGDSGNAENVGAQLHFEIRRPDNTPIDPQPSLLAAQGVDTIDFDVTEVQQSIISINQNKGVSIASSTNCESGSLLTIENTTAVYYCGADGRRYVFPHKKVFDTWYSDFSEVHTITQEQLGTIPLGGVVTYKPGVRMVKIQSDPKVYVVDKGGLLRWVPSSAIAEELYGVDWADYIDDVAVELFATYSIGSPI